jgi:hypothetical protein
MPFLTTIGSAGLFGFGLSSPNVKATIFFWGNGSTDWGNINNWYTDAEHTSQAQNFPSSSDRVELLSNCFLNLDGTFDEETGLYTAWTDLTYWHAPIAIQSASADLTCESTVFIAYTDTNPIPDFDSATAYSVGDVVKDGDNYYILINALDGAGPFDAPSNSLVPTGKWGLIGRYKPHVDNINLGAGHLTLCGVTVGIPS